MNFLLTDDWSSDDEETWAGESLGSCHNFEFLPCEELEAAVNKVEGKDSLSVTNLTLQFLDKEDSTQILRLD